eukprot:1781212-Lingulodinium_polyedra.AAC.1
MAACNIMKRPFSRMASGCTLATADRVQAGIPLGWSCRARLPRARRDPAQRGALQPICASVCTSGISALAAASAAPEPT